MNLTVELTTDQVVSFVQQMPPEERQALLLTIAEQAAANRAARMAACRSTVSAVMCGTRDELGHNDRSRVRRVY